jgi:branched-chain amino acid transport system permease protein
VGALVGLVVAALMLSAPWLGVNAYWQRQVVVIALLTLIVSGLNLSFGYVGELALGQVAVYATGAYISGFLALHGVTELPVDLVAGAIGAVVIGFLTGIPGLRLGGWALALTSFFLVLLVPDIVTIFSSVTGGYSGLFGIGQPQLFGVEVSAEGFYMIVVAVTLIWLMALRNLVVSRHGVAFQSLKASPILASSLGVSVYRTKLLAYSLGAVPAGLAGALFPYLNHLVSPDSFSLDYTIVVVAACVVGGSASVFGAVAGATIFVLGPLRATGFQGGSDIAYGALLIVGGLLFKGGIADLATSWRDKLMARRTGHREITDDAVVISAPPSNQHKLHTKPIVLRTSSLKKHFGGVPAVGGVSLEARSQEITALIGANGSGKTTLLNLLSGFYRPDGGEVFLGEQKISELPPHRIARVGVARTFQTPAIPNRLTTREVLQSGRYTSDYASMWSAIVRGRRFKSVRERDRLEAIRILKLVQLEDWADVRAQNLPLGKLRMLEFGRALMSNAQVFLLDEPASGLDEAEIEELRDVLQVIKEQGAVILLVEHNFPLVMAVADQVVVLGQGRVIASGVPSEIAVSPVVIREYLGQ